MNTVIVKMADLNTAITPDRLKTSGLGSCVGIVIYDSKKGIGGMAHIMLPNSQMTTVGSINKAKYADTAVPMLIEEMVKLGANKHSLKAKLAGGAQMFQFKIENDMMRIGPRNIDASRQILKELGIPITAEDTGGNYGRTIEFSPEDGKLYIKTANQGVKEL